MSDEKPERPPSRPVVIVIEVDRRVSIDEVAEGLMQVTPYFQRVTCWGSTAAFLEDKENEYIQQKDDPFVGWQPTGLVH
jgi:hypothetical protein